MNLHALFELGIKARNTSRIHGRLANLFLNFEEKFGGDPTPGRGWAPGLVPRCPSAALHPEDRLDSPSPGKLPCTGVKKAKSLDRPSTVYCVTFSLQANGTTCAYWTF